MTFSPHIRILMCTLNGAAYLPDQLASFTAQSHRDWSLWVSDDGSDDGTLDVLKDFQTANKDRNIQVFTGPGQGAAANYFSLLTRVRPDPGMLIALSDQDDVWLADKLARAAVAVSTGAGDGPVAYGAAQILADENLGNRRRSRPCPAGPSFGNALVQNILSGSSLVLNCHAQALVQRALPDRAVPFHDWWIYQILSGAGGDIIADPEPALIYRQHANNLLGANRGLTARLRRSVLLGNRRYSGWIDQNTKALAACTDVLTDPNRALLDRFIKARARAGLARIQGFFAAGIHRQGRGETFALYMAALLGRS